MMTAMSARAQSTANCLRALSAPVDSASRSDVATCHAVAGVDWLDRLAGVRTPTLVLAGARDVGATPEMAKAIADRIPGAELRVFQNASHLSVAEVPETFEEDLGAFLAKLD